MKPYTDNDLQILERAHFDKKHAKSSRRMDGDMALRNLMRRLDQETLTKMYAVLKAAGRLANWTPNSPFERK